METNRLIESVIAAVWRVLPEGQGPFALHEPHFAGNEWRYVKECLDTGWVSSVGAYVDAFESRLAEYADVRRAVAVVNGTAALHTGLRLIGVERGEEVIVPALTFVATANAVAYCGAVPHFVDSEERTLGLDASKLERHLSETAEVTRDGCRNRLTGRPIRAVIAMHAFGHPVDLDALAEVCRRFRLELIEDAAEALGSYYKGEHVGNRGRVSVLSFNGNKTITTGGGGALLTNDPDLADRAKHLTTTAKLPHPLRYDHDQLGYNYRLPNLNAAVGCAQLEQMPSLLERKRVLAARYARAFERVSGVRFVVEPDFGRSNYWLNTLLLAPEFASSRDDLLARMNDRGIGVRPAWTLMPKLPMYRDCPRMDLSASESIQARLLNLPSSPVLGSIPEDQVPAAEPADAARC